MADPPLTYVQIEIGGMRGPECVLAVERCLGQLVNPQSVRVTHPPGRAWVSFTDEIDLHAAIEALESRAYTVKAVNLVDGPPRSTSSSAGNIRTVVTFLGRMIRRS